MPITSMCSALVAIIGTHYGAGNIRYVKRTHTYCTLYATLAGLVICALFVIFSDQLASIFLLNSTDGELIGGISQFIKITAFCIPFLGLGLPSTYLYQGLGKGIYSLCWTTTCEVICAVPASYFFAFIMDYGLIGIWIGFVVGRGIACILNVIVGRYSILKLEKSNTT